MKIGIDIGTKDHTAVMLTDPPHAWVDVLTERQRQQDAEGWTPEHDDAYQAGDLATAASCYAFHAGNHSRQAPRHLPPPAWPWAKTWWKPTDPRRALVKAGALILAEIERLDRAEAAKGKRGA